MTENDSGSLREAIMKLLGNQNLRCEMSRKGLLLIKDKFDKKKTFQQLVRVFGLDD